MRPGGLLAPLAVGGLLAVLGGIAGCGKDATGRQPGQSAEAAFELPGPQEVREWSADRDLLVEAEGRVTLDGEPVAGARIEVGDYPMWAPTDGDGRFAYPLDITLPRRYPVTVADAERATVDGKRLTSEQRAALEDARGSITAAHRLDELKASADGQGITISGRVTLDGEPVQPVALSAYELTGTVTDESGRPVEGAIVSTRTTDRDFWTFSDPSDARGRYSSNFAASDRVGSSPVPITVHVAVGDDAHAFLPDENVPFDRLKSAELDISLPPEGFPMALPEPRSYRGARYKGVVVGVGAGDRAARPLRATWPDERGRFQLMVPDSLGGQVVSLWTGELELFSRRPAEPGGEIDLGRWPQRLRPEVPRDLARLELPSR